MKKLLLIFLFSGFILIAINAFQKFGRELECYQCNSLTQPHCSDFFDNQTVIIERCPNDGRNYTMCRKIIQELYYDGIWEKRYYRDCAVTGVIGAEEGRWCTDRMGTLRVKVRYCHCNNKQGCNSGTSISIGLILILCACLTAISAYFPT